MNLSPLDIKTCRICGAWIVTEEYNELPCCNRVDCFRSAFPDAFRDLLLELDKKPSKLKPPDDAEGNL